MCRATHGETYSRWMGSSGMKRKGRRHLPKVGTPAANQHELHDRREEALHPFSTDPTRRGGIGAGMIAAIVVILVVLGIIALVLLT